MKKKCKAMDKETCSNILNKLLEIKSIAKTIIILSIEFDYGLLPLAEILNNKIDDAAKIINE